MKTTNAHILENVRPLDRWTIATIEVLAVAGALFLAAQAKIPLPWTPVPITLQTVPVLAAGYVVGRERAVMGIALYLALGAVFKAAGIEQLSFFAAPYGATTGFLLAFAAVPFVTASIRRPVLALATATLTMYAAGSLWLCYWAGVGLVPALWMAVIPFVPGDLLKAAAVYPVARRASR